MEFVCVCERERERVCVRERESVCERERVWMRMCPSEREEVRERESSKREREREAEREREREKERERERAQERAKRCMPFFKIHVFFPLELLLHRPLGPPPSQQPIFVRRGINLKGFKDFCLKPKPECALDCHRCAKFARQRPSPHPRVRVGDVFFSLGVQPSTLKLHPPPGGPCRPL